MPFLGLHTHESTIQHPPDNTLYATLTRQHAIRSVKYTQIRGSALSSGYSSDKGASLARYSPWRGCSVGQLFKDRTGRHHHLLNLIMAPTKKTTAATANTAFDPDPNTAASTGIPTELPTHTDGYTNPDLVMEIIWPAPKVRIPFPLLLHLSLSPAQQLTLSGAI